MKSENNLPVTDNKEISITETEGNVASLTFEIGRGYLKLLVFLSTKGQELTRQSFEENPIPFLTATKLNPWQNAPHVGMKLPEDTIVKLDAQAAWPTLYLQKVLGKREKKVPENLITISEKSLRVSATWGKGYNSTPQRDTENEYTSELLLDAGCGADIKFIPGKPADYSILLIMPYPIPAYDELVNVYFESNSSISKIEKTPDIILTCC
jgi:hypothetical protein